jgi:hypothetical protein
VVYLDLEDPLGVEETRVDGTARTVPATGYLASEWGVEEAPAAPAPPVGPATEEWDAVPAAEPRSVPAEVEALFEGAPPGATVGDEGEREALRLENLRREYDDVISRLPWGIPSEELKAMDRSELVDVLATGERRTVEGGNEVVNVRGRWYFSDHERPGTFLKEHGGRQKAAAAGDTEDPVDREQLLAILEERFIMGEVSEESYLELREKYGG